jgi:hypothetical protein
MESAVHIHGAIHPSAALGTIATMLLARIVCSDPRCPEELEVAIEGLEDLDGFVCECGFGFQLMDVAELREAGGSVIALPARRRAPERRAA